MATSSQGEGQGQINLRSNSCNENKIFEAIANDSLDDLLSFQETRAALTLGDARLPSHLKLPCQWTGGARLLVLRRHAPSFPSRTNLGQWTGGARLRVT
jgi:hypothetical protein